MLRMPASNREGPIPRGMNVIAVSIQVEVVVGAGVPTNTSAVALAQSVAADLSGSCNISDVVSEPMADKGLYHGAVIL